MAGPNDNSVFIVHIMTDAYKSYIYSQVVPDPSSWQSTPATITNVTTTYTEYILAVWTKHKTVGTNLGIICLLLWLGKLLVSFFCSLTVCILKQSTWVSTFLQFNTRVEAGTMRRHQLWFIRIYRYWYVVIQFLYCGSNSEAFFKTISTAERSETVSAQYSRFKVCDCTVKCC